MAQGSLLNKTEPDKSSPDTWVKPVMFPNFSGKLEGFLLLFHKVPPGPLAHTVGKGAGTCDVGQTRAMSINLSSMWLKTGWVSLKMKQREAVREEGLEKLLST